MDCIGSFDPRVIGARPSDRIKKHVKKTTAREEDTGLGPELVLECMPVRVQGFDVHRIQMPRS